MAREKSFIIDFRRFVLMMLPTMLRKTFIYHLLYRMLAPWVTVYQNFYKKRMLNLYIAKYDSGKGNIERMLNALYADGLTSKIKIVMLSKVTPSVVGKYLTEDMADDGIYLGDGCYIDGYTVSTLFKVTIPKAVVDDASARGISESALKKDIENRVKMYVLPGIGFEIEILSE